MIKDHHGCDDDDNDDGVAHEEFTENILYMSLNDFITHLFRIKATLEFVHMATLPCYLQDNSRI
jgi:hypothetical protein